MSKLHVEPVTLPLLVVDLILYYRQFYFDDIIIMYAGEYSDRSVIGVFDNAYSIIDKMIIETDRHNYQRRSTGSDCSDKNIKILGWYINYDDYHRNANNQLFLSFPITELLLNDWGTLSLIYIDSDKEKRIETEFEWFSINDIYYGENAFIYDKDHPQSAHESSSNGSI